MGLLRHNTKSDRQTLLEPRRRGLFSTKNNRSEDILESRRGRSFFRSVRRKEKMANEYYFADEQFNNTPPVTPSASPEAKNLFSKERRVESPKPLRNVTVTEMRATQQPQQLTHAQQQQQQRIPTEDNNTVVSELTNPQDITPRLRSFQSLQQQQLHRQPKDVMKQTIASTPPRTTTSSPQPSPPPAHDDNIVNRVLGLMEISCFSPFHPSGSDDNNKNEDNDDIRRNLSFMPEWGVAPTMLSNEDEEEGVDSSKDRSGSSNHRWYLEDSTYSSKTYSSTRETSFRTGQSMPHHHLSRNHNSAPEENFEMVLEEEQQKKYSYKIPNRRGWMMNLGSSGNNNNNNNNGATAVASTATATTQAPTTSKNKTIEPVLGIAPRERQHRSETPPAALVAAASGRTAVHHYAEQPRPKTTAALQQQRQTAAQKQQHEQQQQQAPRERSASPPKQRQVVASATEEEKKEDDRPVVAAVAAIARRAAASSPPPKLAAPKKTTLPPKARATSPSKMTPPTMPKAASTSRTTAPQFVTPPRQAMAVVRPSSPDPPGAGQHVGGNEGLEAVPPGSPLVATRSSENIKSNSVNNKSKKVNPAAVLLRKARQARERKKAADKERRYKKILQSLDKTSQKPLPTVVEEDKSLEECKSVTSKPEVRVPGIQTADEYLKASELLGSEYVEENTQVLSSSSRPCALSDDPVEVLDNKQQAAPEQILRSPSWREMLGKKLRHQPLAKKSSVKSKSDPGTSTFSMKAAAGALLGHMKKKEDLEPTGQTKKPSTPETKEVAAAEKKKVQPKEKTPKETTLKAKPTHAKKTEPERLNVDEKKPCWKAAVDPKSGRTYYYHRVTRETTWKKPPQHEIVQPIPAQPAEPALKGKQKVDSVRVTETPAGKSKDCQPKQEDTILSYLREMAGNSTPFDESVVKKKDLAGPSTLAERSRTVLSGRTTLGSGHTNASAITGAASVRSGISGKLSEQTPQIKNTSRGRRLPAVAAIKENESQGTSISSKHGDLHLPVKSSPDRSTDTSPTLPSHIPVPRRRELKVEDFSSDRRTEVFEARRRARPRPLASWSQPKTPPVVQEKRDPPHDAAAYMGDTEGTDSIKETESYENSAAFDSISALSEPEQDSASCAARRRALNDAIAREDWDLAANLSEGMRTIKSRETAYAAGRREWTQSELDRFISENDWDAVANYIAHVRTKTKEEEKKAQEASRGPKNEKKYQSVLDSNGSPVKRFGARSQLQHNELNSDESSWASTYSSYYSDGYSSESESFISDDDRVPRRRSKKEFAC